MFDINSDNFQ